MIDYSVTQTKITTRVICYTTEGLRGSIYSWIRNVHKNATFNYETHTNTIYLTAFHFEDKTRILRIELDNFENIIMPFFNIVMNALEEFGKDHKYFFIWKPMCT